MKPEFPEGPFARIVRKNLLDIVAAYRKATGKSLTQMSKEFYGNADFFQHLQSGKRSISVANLDQMLTAIRKEWPEGVRWPTTRAIVMGQSPQE